MKKNILLKKKTTFKIGGKARYFFILKKKQEISKIIKKIKKLKTKFFVLGGGSNVLASDKGYKGAILKIENKEIKIEKHRIFAGAGLLFDDLVSASLKKSLTGLEWAAGIPGTIGGAIYGNAGAFKKSIKNNLEWVEVFDAGNFLFAKIPISCCGFSNKESVFKKNRNLIIMSACFKLKKGDKAIIKKTISEFLKYRKENHPLSFPSAGCIFKNYEGKITNKKIIKNFPEIKEFNKTGFIPASYLIDKSGLKSKKINGARVSRKHANFIINIGNAKQKDVLALISEIKRKVKANFNVNLEEEVQKI